MEWLESTIYGNSLRQWLIFLGASVGVYVGLRGVLWVVRERLKHVADSTLTGWDDILVTALAKTKHWVLAILSLYAGLILIVLPDALRSVLDAVAVVAFLFQSGLWLSGALGAWLQRYTERGSAADRRDVTTMKAMVFLGNVVIWIAVLLVALDNLGIEITALVAGLGIGGVAVALAVQSILSDVFASLSIVLDKPFVLGDFVIVDDYRGSVEHIGFKTTQLRSLSGEQIVFSNSDLLSSRLRNYGRMAERRIAFEVGVTYQTPRAKVTRIPELIRESVEAQPGTRFERAHFKAYGDFALTFEAVFFVLSPDYNVYMDIQQAINLAIHEQFEREGIDFAYPTQTLFVSRNEAPDGERGT